ncbi:MAG: S1C family serine protease [Thermoguttaceae bacterium]
MLTWKRFAAAAAIALIAAAAARADDEPTAVAAGSAQAETAPGEAQGAWTMRSEYWLGMFASRISPALQSQLRLPKDQGLLVEALQPESPAVKAGLQQYDILLKGNDKPLTDRSDLLQLIDQVKDGTLTLDLLRAGKHETVRVVPAKRPAHEPGGPWIPEGATAGGLRAGRNFMEGGPLEFRVIRPGQILPPGDPMTNHPGGGPKSLDILTLQTTLADGSKLEITQHGSEQAKVVVTHDKDKWEGTSSDLSKIPEKIRPEVERLLQPVFDHNRIFSKLGEGTMTFVGSAVAAPGFSGHSAVPPDVEKRLGEMQRQIDELRQSVDALQSNTNNKSKSTPKSE